MVISFLQQRNPPILPILQEIERPQEKDEKYMIDDNDCYYYKEFKGFEHKNTESLGDLLFYFFDYFCRFDFQTNVVSIRVGKPLKKSEKVFKISEYKRDFFCLAIEDPFNVSSSVGSNIYYPKFVKIINQFQRAFDCLHSGKGLEHVIFGENFEEIK